MNDTFTLYDLKVTVVGDPTTFVCSHQVGSYFLVEGENLVFPQPQAFSMYALSALLPLLPAKQRVLNPNDWMVSDTLIACPDPNCHAQFEITHIGKRIQYHSETTVAPLVNTIDEEMNDAK